MSQRAKESYNNIENKNLYHISDKKFHHAVELDPNNGDAWFEWGMVFFRKIYQAEGLERKDFLDELKSKLIKAKSLGKQKARSYLTYLDTLHNSNSPDLMKHLQAAKEIGYFSLNDLKSSKDFDAIRDTPEFKAIIEVLEQEEFQR